MNIKNLKKIGLTAILLSITIMPITSNASMFEGTPQANDVNLEVTANYALSMSVSTNSIDFGEYNGIQNIYNNDLTLTVDSGLNYDIDVYASNLVGTTDSTSNIALSNLGIKTGAMPYKYFDVAEEKLSLIQNAPHGRGKTHSIDLELKADASVKADVYTGTLRFDITQQ